MLLALYLVMVIALPLALGSYALYRGLPRSRACPCCGATTSRLRAPSLSLASRILLRRSTLQRRWCIACGWEGQVSLPRERTGRARSRRSSAPAPRPARVQRTSSLEVRRLEVDGETWRVRVQCWAEGDRWLGRLLFVAPGGRVWVEETSLEGASVQGVLGRALTLPERTLAGRLRRVVR